MIEIVWDCKQSGADQVVVTKWATEISPKGVIPLHIYDALKWKDWSEAVVKQLRDQAARNSFVPASEIPRRLDKAIIAEIQDVISAPTLNSL